MTTLETNEKLKLAPAFIVFSLRHTPAVTNLLKYEGPFLTVIKFWDPPLPHMLTVVPLGSVNDKNSVMS